MIGEVPVLLEVATWVEGSSFCIFFGKTPVSTEDEFCAYSDVNVIGRIFGITIKAKCEIDKSTPASLWKRRGSGRPVCHRQTGLSF